LSGNLVPKGSFQFGFEVGKTGSYLTPSFVKLAFASSRSIFWAYPLLWGSRLSFPLFLFPPIGPGWVLWRYRIAQPLLREGGFLFQPGDSGSQVLFPFPQLSSLGLVKFPSFGGFLRAKTPVCF